MRVNIDLLQTENSISVRPVAGFEFTKIGGANFRIAERSANRPRLPIFGLDFRFALGCRRKERRPAFDHGSPSCTRCGLLVGLVVVQPRRG